MEIFNKLRCRGSRNEHSEFKISRVRAGHDEQLLLDNTLSLSVQPKHLALTRICPTCPGCYSSAKSTFTLLANLSTTVFDKNYWVLIQQLIWTKFQTYISKTIGNVTKTDTWMKTLFKCWVLSIDSYILLII